MKRLFTILALVALWQTSIAYNFSDVAPSGQTLYYNTTSTAPYPRTVYVTSSGSADLRPSGNVIIPSSVYYNGIVYYVVGIGQSAFANCSLLSSVVIPEGVTYIGQNAFYGCTNLDSIIIPSSVNSIMQGAFMGCTGLSVINILTGLTTIGYTAFQGCTSLRSITIPSSVTQMDGRVFWNCTNLDTLKMRCSNPPLYSGAIMFSNNPASMKIYVPCGSYSQYYQNWSETSIRSRLVESANMLNINVSSHNETRGSAYVRERTMVCDSSYVVIEAVPTNHYHFEHWNNGSVNNPDTIHYSGDSSFIAFFEIDHFDLSLNVNDSLRGSVFGPQVACYADTAIITAIPNYGYHFSHWNNGSTSNPDTIIITRDTSVTAIFAPNQYAVVGTVGTAVNFSEDFEQISSNNSWTLQNGNNVNKWFINTLGPGNRALFISSDGGQSNSCSNGVSTGVYAYKSLTLREGQYQYSYNWRGGTSDGYYLSYIRVALLPDYLPINASQWGENSLQSGAMAMDGGHKLYGASSWQTKTGYLNITNTGTYKIVFYWDNSYYPGSLAAAVDNITISSNATVTVPGGIVTGSDTVNYLNTVTLTAVPSYGYHFMQWHDGITLNPRNIVAIHDSIFYAYFDYNQYHITLGTDTSIHGTVAGSGSFNYLSNRQIQATASFGYHFSHWNDGDTNNPRTIVLTQDTSFTAYFANNQYSVIGVPNNAAYGTVSGNDTVDYLDTVVLTATANVNYYFDHWSDGSTDNPHAVVANNNRTITAYFNPVQFTLSVTSIDETMGHVSGGGSYSYLSNRTISASANNGYHFTQWNDGETNRIRTVTLTQDTTFTAYFAPNQYTLTLLNANPDMGSIEGGGTYDYLDTVTISATAEEHHHFLYWGDGNSNNPRQYIITADASLTAYFAIDTHTVAISANDIARGSVSSSGTAFVYGTPCTVTATAYTGYMFVKWSNGVTANPYTFAVMEDVELTAIFLSPDEMVTITAESGNPSMGTATVNGTNSVTVMSGEEVILTATPFSGYRFLRWQDDDTLATRIVTATSSITYTAYFEANVGIENVDGNALVHHVYADGGKIVVTGAEGKLVCLYDMMGRQLATWRACNDPITFDVPAAGVYLVRIGDAEVRKVAVVR